MKLNSYRTRPDVNSLIILKFTLDSAKLLIWRIRYNWEYKRGTRFNTLCEYDIPDSIMPNSFDIQSVAFRLNGVSIIMNST